MRKSFARGALTGAAVLLTAIPAAPVVAHAQGRSGIEMGALERLDAWSVGGVGRQEGALGGVVWANSDPRLLAAVFDATPAAFQSPAAQALARIALASPGRAPPGDAMEAGRKRFEALARMGAAAETALMGAGSLASDPAIAQFAAQAELGRGRLEAACQRVRAASGQPSPFILRLRAMCLAAEGDASGAQLALALAREAGAEDAWFSAAFGVLTGAAPARPPAARYDTSLNAALSLAAGLSPGRTPLNGASTLALSAVSRSDAATPALRAQAAMLALARGAVSAQEARSALRAAFAADAAAAPVLARLLAQIEAEPGGMSAAAAITEALAAARGVADFTAVARLLQPDIARLTIAPDAAATLLLARAALAHGDVALAARLSDAAEAAGAPATALGPLRAAVVAGSDQVSPEAAAFAITRRLDAGAGPGAAGASRDIAILAALGHRLDGAARAHLLAHPPSGGRASNAGLFAALEAAVAQEAMGEAALLAALICAEGAAGLDAASATAVVRALMALELYDHAAAVAVEAIAGFGG